MIIFAVIMGKKSIPILSTSQRTELERQYREGKTHKLRIRSQIILLKSEGHTSQAVGKAVKMSHRSVNYWLKRYKEGGIESLQTAPGRRRRSIITDSDTDSLLEAIKNNRQRVQTAKAEWEQQSWKSVCINTFKSFFLSLAEDINV